MRHIRSFLIFFSAFVLVVLLLVSSTDLVLKEQDNTVHNISVIFNEMNDDDYINFKLGMEQGILDWTADVSFITLYSRNDVEQQMSLILREIENGAEAIIIFPADSENLAYLLEQNPVNIPVICIGTDVDSQKVSVYIGGDHFNTGFALGKEIIKNTKIKLTKDKIYAFSDVRARADIDELFRGLKQASDEEQISILKCVYQDQDTFREKVDTLLKNKPNSVFIALDTYTMQRFVSDYLEQEEHLNLYGIGYTNKILYYLSNQSIQAIAVYNDYLMGYLSIQKTVEILKGKDVYKDMLMDSYIIQQQDVFKKKYERILFPIE